MHANLKCLRPLSSARPRAVKCYSNLTCLSRPTYREQLACPGKFVGTSHVHLSWDLQTGEDDYREMVREFAMRPGFPNVSWVTLDAPHLMLDGAFIAELAMSKPLLKHLQIKAWAFCGSEKPAAFTQLNVVDIDLCDGVHFPHGIDQILRVLPRRLQMLHVTDRGPHYCPIDCSLLPRCDVMSLSGVTLKNRLCLIGQSVITRDCR